MIEPVLVIPDLNKEMRMEANASDFATGEVLSMKCENEKWMLVSQMFRGMETFLRRYQESV